MQFQSNDLEKAWSLVYLALFLLYLVSTLFLIFEVWVLRIPVTCWLYVSNCRYRGRISIHYLKKDDTKGTHDAKVLASSSSYPSEPGILLLQVRDLKGERFT